MLMYVNAAPSPSPEAATASLTAAIDRGRIARLAWTKDGTLITAADYAAARGIPPSALPELEAQGELFSLDSEGSRWYPSELLKLSADESRAVCGTLSGLDAAQQLVFVMRKHGSLAGQPISVAIAQGKLAEVLRLAYSWRLESWRASSPLAISFHRRLGG